MQWSPKMDLIALSLITGEVALHRLSWQKVRRIMRLNAHALETYSLSKLYHTPAGTTYSHARLKKRLLVNKRAYTHAIANTLTLANIHSFIRSMRK